MVADVIGLTVGNLRALWADLPDDVMPEVSFSGITGLVIRSSAADPHTPGAHLTVGPITMADVKAAIK